MDEWQVEVGRAGGGYGGGRGLRSMIALSSRLASNSCGHAG